MGYPLLLVAVVTFALPCTLRGQSVQNLPSYDMVVDLTELYQNRSALITKNNEDRFFPSVRFTHSGSIIGWRFPAAPGAGGATPVVSILRPLSGSMYQRVSNTSIDNCNVSQYLQESGVVIEIHESGPVTPIPFQKGDIFGLHLRRNDTAHFEPYLYNSSLVGEYENTSYFLERTNIRDSMIDLQSSTGSDTLQPLFALATCADYAADSIALSIPCCNGQTLNTCDVNVTVTEPALTECPTPEPTTVPPTVRGQSVQNLPSYDMIVDLTELYYTQSALITRNNEDRFFPSVHFTHSGSIIGWRFPAAPGAGGATPVVSILRPLLGSIYDYQRVSNTNIDNCNVSQYLLESGVVIEIHESGPVTPIPFQEGDIFGLHLRRNDTAHFEPYLYNSSLVGEYESTSYFLERTQIRDSMIDLQSTGSDTLQPLFALATCTDNDADSMSLGIPLCNGQTLIACDVVPTELTPTQSTEASRGIRPELLVVAITVPILVVLLLLVCGMAALMFYCVWSIRASKKKRHSMYAEEIAMDDLNGVVPTAISHLEEDNYDKIVNTSTMTREVSNDIYSPNIQTEKYHEGNGAVANYEEPVFSLSQSVDSVNHFYNKPQNVNILPSNTPPPPFSSTTSLHSHPSHPPTPSPQSHHSHLPSTPSPQPSRANSSGYYHSLERPNKTAVSSLAIRSVNSPRSNVTTPDLPHVSCSHSNTLPVDWSSSDHSLSPKPHHRLKSAPNPGSRISPQAAVGSEVPRPQSEQGYTTPRSNDYSFKLETGVYVPTQKQLTELSSNPRASVFDDTIYDCLSQRVDGPIGNNWRFFEELDSYWRPASSTSVLYQQLASRKYREIIRKQIQIVSHLGSGEFGTVCKGVWHTEQGELDVAVKMLTSKSNEETTVRFLQEAAIMGQFRHPNIVRLHGVVTVGDPVMIVLELVNNGDMRKYLKSVRPTHNQPLPANLPQQLLEFSSQIALGMEYLARKEFVHRDLAARNILLTDDFICKIADFGLSRDLEDEEYYVSNGGKVPIKWTAPEALHYRKYSPASDVWSFGALLYEIWSLGHTPFNGKTAEETVSLVNSGYRLPPPPGCPRAIYQLIIECWHPDALDRPSFTDLVKSLSQPEETLLRWSHSDTSLLPQAFTLGADLSYGEQLFTDLQKMYQS